MKSKDGRQYCDFCRRWLDGDSYWVDVPKNLYFCDPSCAGHAKSYSAECVSVPKAPKPESVPTQQPLEVPDIYLAELVGVIRRALQADGLTERLWAILDDWCDEQESYLEKKYPEAHEQATARDSVTVDWRASAYCSPELGAYQRASDELMERFPRWLIPESPPFGERGSALIDEILKTGLGSVDVAREGVSFSMRDSGIEYTSIDGQRCVVAGNDSACTCQGFQGDNLTCAFHGEGTAWHDLHRGE